jgi:hypothetical protein
MRGAGETEQPVPRCLSCAYALEGLPATGECPECGRSYDLDDAATFTTKPPFIGWKFWLPGLAMSMGAGVAMYAVLWSGMRVANWPLWLGVGVSVGCILGYRARVNALALPLLGLAALVGVVVGLVSVGQAGAFCGLILACVFLVPLFGGVFLGAALRSALKNSRFSQRSYLPVIGFMAAPVVTAAIFGNSGAVGVEAIKTSEFVAASPQECWDALQFYAEVEHEPPLLLRLTLPRPLRTTGRATQPGDTKTCVYTTGRLVKLVTGADAPASLRFTVIEQSLGIEREVRLAAGEFAFDAVEGGTRITLTTRYEPMLTPRWAWRPAERLAVRALHRHVIEGMRHECAGTPRVARGTAFAEPGP